MSLDLQPGDIVRVTKTLRLDSVSPESIHGYDVNSDAGCHFTIRPRDTLKIEMVKRTSRMHRGPKPEAGKLLKGSSIKHIWWKRGTIIQFWPWPAEETSPYSALVLGGDGIWYQVDDPTADPIEFDELNDDAKFKLLHVA